MNPLFPQQGLGESEIRAAFVRQRRNLIAISLVLLFAETTGISVDHLNILGIEIELDNPNSVIYWLWAGYWYWLLRYYQFFLATTNKGIQAGFESRLLPVLARFAMEKEEVESEELKSARLASPNRSVRLHNLGAYFVKDMPHNSVTAQFNVITVGTTSEGGNLFNEIPQKTYTFSRRRLLLPVTRAALLTAINTPVFSEYFLPFAIALAPPIYWLAIQMC
ncbi:MAG: hypothetical protein AABM64_11930 [Pseudomonadota bacterium]